MSPRPLESDQFEAFLTRLSPDRDHAGRRYESLRARLIALFTYRGCPIPEELADETLDRTARKVADLPASAVPTDPSPLVFGIAWNVARESFHTPRWAPLPDCDLPDPIQVTSDPLKQEREQRCLDRCLDGLGAAESQLVLAYFAQEKRAKIEQRSRLAADLGISQNALRLRVHRITSTLRACLDTCLQ